jgi:glycosyltransferase involved in cell wall biosynthesis
MKILRIADIPNNRTGGMSRTMYGTGDALVGAGHHVDYLFAEDIGGVRSPRVRRFLTPLRIPAIVDRTMASGNRYDVVELHEILAAPLLFRRRFVPKQAAIVLFCYGLVVRLRADHLEYLKLKGLRVSTRDRYSLLPELLQAMYAIRRSDHVICSNSDDVNYLVRIGIPRHRITQHHSGVDDRFLKAGAALTSAAPRRSGILFLASWLIRKGIRDLVPAVSRVMKNHPDVTFTAAGCCCPPEIVRNAFPRELRSRIEVISHLATDEDIIRACEGRSVFVLPSYSEGQPLAMMEAAALGLAIVTTDSPGMRDFIEQDVNGLLIAMGDVDALTECLDRLVTESGRARMLGEAARKKVHDFTWTNAARRLEDAYRKAIDHS